MNATLGATNRRGTAAATFSLNGRTATPAGRKQRRSTCPAPTLVDSSRNHCIMGKDAGRVCANGPSVALGTSGTVSRQHRAHLAGALPCLCRLAGPRRGVARPARSARNRARGLRRPARRLLAGQRHAVVGPGGQSQHRGSLEHARGRRAGPLPRNRASQVALPVRSRRRLGAERRGARGQDG